MKGILEFNLPEEQTEFKVASNGGSYIAALEEFDRILKRLSNIDTENEMYYEVLEEVKKEFYELLVDRGIDLYE